MLTVIVFGNQQISIDCLRILLNFRNVKVPCVVGSELPRDKTFGYPSVAEFCKTKKIKFYNPEVLDEKFFEVIKEYRPDLCFSIYYRKILDKNFVNLPRKGFVNMHPSLLPHYRGPAPTMWALINGEKVTGMTMHYIDEGVDTGDIISQVKVNIPTNITGFGLNTLVMKKGVQLFKKQIPKILNHRNRRLNQDPFKATYYGPYVKSISRIDWFDGKEKIKNRVSALTKPYAGTYSLLESKKIIIWKVKILRRFLKGAGGPGRITQVDKTGNFVVRCADGYIKAVDYLVEKVNKKYWPKYIKVGNKFEL